MHGGEHVRDRVTRQQQEIEAREREMNLRLPFTTVLPASSAAHSPSPTLPYQAREREIVKQQEAERQAMQVRRAATATTTTTPSTPSTATTSPRPARNRLSVHFGGSRAVGNRRAADSFGGAV